MSTPRRRSLFREQVMCAPQAIAVRAGPCRVPTGAVPFRIVDLGEDGEIGSAVSGVPPAVHDFVRCDGSPRSGGKRATGRDPGLRRRHQQAGRVRSGMASEHDTPGQNEPDYPGEITNHHGFRFTPEFSYGLTSDVELGLYLPMLVDGGGDYHFVGVKYRLKWLPVRPKDDGRRMVPRRQQRAIASWLQVF